MNIKCTGKFIGGELISREGGKNEHPADRKLKVYRCFSISIAAAFQGRAVISIDQLFRRCFEKVAATHHTPPSFLSLPPSSNSNRSRTRILELYADYIARVTIGTLSRYENKTRRDPVAASFLLVSSRANNSTNAVSS